MGQVIISNIVKKDTLRDVQQKTLADIASYLKTSFGPFGSNSIIKKGPDAATEYTKDGHDILSQIKYNGPIESTIVEDLVDITRYVVKVVGDGTTSAVEMSNLIFEGISSLEGKYRAYDIIFAFKNIVDKIIEEIKKHSKECTLDDIYDIAYTSTNGNKKLAENLYTLYKDYGFNIYIDLQVALNSPEDIIKIYDGMTIDSGYTDGIFVNRDNAICEIHNPHMYFFESPVDTPEMIHLFDSIIYNNILKHYQSKDPSEPVPTVILVPFISADMSSYLNDLTKFMMKFPLTTKPPIAIIKAYSLEDQLSDMAMMCGAPMIKKYINDEIHQEDIASNRAPTIDNVVEFYGSCEMISITKDNTKVIRPAKMFNEDGSTTETFNSLLSWCENELERAKNENKNSVTIHGLKKRINSLKSNLIEYFVGGISISERDNNRALLEDAIKNCSSAITNGVGFGANVEGLRAITNIKEEYDNNLTDYKDSLESDIINIIYNAYLEMVYLLYPTEVNNESLPDSEEEIDLTIDDTSADEEVEIIEDETIDVPEDNITEVEVVSEEANDTKDSADEEIEVTEDEIIDISEDNNTEIEINSEDVNNFENVDFNNSDSFEILRFVNLLSFSQKLIEKGPYNLRTGEFDGKVKSSIMSDAIILEAISRIIVRMATAEQFILPSPAHNVYEMKDK